MLTPVVHLNAPPRERFANTPSILTESRILP